MAETPVIDHSHEEQLVEAADGARLNRIPPLQAGDLLTRREFERRYEAMPHIKKAELIEGVVYMGSPVHVEAHASPHANMVGWLTVYRAATPGIRLADNATLRLDPDNEPQPDIMAWIGPDTGGKSRRTEDDYLEGAPELIVEIAATSASIDLRDKKRVYRRAGVQEYIVWQVYDRRIDWWELREGEYIPLQPDAAGVVRSQVFPGLWLDVPSMLTDDMAKVLAVLQLGIGTPEHAAFVERLRTKKTS
jgi:Uma2 family endonuclease